MATRQHSQLTNIRVIIVHIGEGVVSNNMLLSPHETAKHAKNWSPSEKFKKRKILCIKDYRRLHALKQAVQHQTDVTLAIHPYAANFLTTENIILPASPNQI